jgi:predicted transcriptional regulator
VFAAIENSCTMLDEVDEITSGWRANVKARSDSTVWPLTELLVRQPAVNMNLAVERLGVSKQAATSAINALEHAGVLVKAKGEERNRAWVAVEIVSALDRFAERIGRRDRRRQAGPPSAGTISPISTKPATSAAST